MFTFAILIAAQTLSATPTTEVIDRGRCPAAYIDYDFYHKKYRDPNYIPVTVLLDARDGLRKCHEDGIEVPSTVAEYNNRYVMDSYTEYRIKRDLTPRKPFGEF